MKRLCAVSLLAIAGWVWAQQPPAGIHRVAQLGWLAGCWTGEVQAGVFEECWTVPRGDSIQVSARIVSNGKTVFREFISVDDVPDGVIMTIQHFRARLEPEGDRAGFRLVKLTDAGAIFENPQHDFPQRIAYLKQPDGSVIARISLLDGTKAEDYPMRKPRR